MQVVEIGRMATPPLMYSGNLADARAPRPALPGIELWLGPRLNLYPFCLSLLFVPYPVGLATLPSFTHLSCDRLHHRADKVPPRNQPPTLFIVVLNLHFHLVFVFL